MSRVSTKTSSAKIAQAKPSTQKVSASKPSMPSTSASNQIAKPIKAAPVATATPSPWRCPVCTFMNRAELDQCSKCQEPVSLELKMQRSVAKEREIRAGGMARVPDHVEADVLKPAQQFAVAQAAQAAKTAPAPAPAHRFPPPQMARGGGGGGGGGSGAAEKKISKANIHGVIQSRLNHDTASYRGKFESENAVPAKVTTLSSMKKNGFISSATRAPSTMAAKAAASSAASASVSAPARSVHAAAPAAAVPYFNAHEARQLKKFDGGVAHGPSLIDMLQSAASGAAQASLKHTGTSVRAEKKALAGDQYTKFEL